MPKINEYEGCRSGHPSDQEGEWLKLRTARTKFDSKNYLMCLF